MQEFPRRARNTVYAVYVSMIARSCAVTALVFSSNSLHAQQQAQLPLGDPPATQFDERSLGMQNRTEAMTHKITGINKSASFYDPGSHLLHESQIRHITTLNTSWRSSFDATVRYTDSQQFDPNYWSVQSLAWKLNDTTRELNFGDYYANLSQYSLNKGIKGVAFQMNMGNDQNYVRAGWGTFDGQWAYLLRKDRVDEPMDRYGTGVRLQRAGENWRAGLNLAHIRDRVDDPKRGTADAYSQYIPAFDWEYREAAFVLTGEHAYSNTTLLPLAAATRTTSGTAHKLTLRSSVGIVNIDGNLERVQPDFLTLGGSATPDRQREYLKVDARIARLWGLYGSFDRTRDNLAERLTRTTHNLSEEIGLRRQRAFDRNTLSISTSLRRREIETSDSATLRTSNRFKVSVTDRFFDVADFRSEYEKILDRDYRTASQTNANYLFNFAISSRHQVGSWQLNPGIEYGVQDNQNRTLGGWDLTEYTRLAFFGNNERGSQFGVNYDRNITNLRTVGGDARLNRATAWWQTSPGWLNGGSLRFEVTDNLYKFEDSNRDYREQLGRMVVQWSLERASKKP